METMRELSLFSGAGGGLLGTKLLGWRHCGYVEYNEYCQKVIAQRIKDGILDEAPIFGDIRTFLSEGYAESYQGMVDVITAGFPCQPYSTAARGRNPQDTMWEMAKTVVKTVRPIFIFCENVSRKAISMAEMDLRAMGYIARKIPLCASDLGADHERRRFWLGAYSNHESKLFSEINAEMAKLPPLCPGIWTTEPNKPRISNGVAYRLEQFRAIGNGQVPAVVRAAWRILSDNL